MTKYFLQFKKLFKSQDGLGVVEILVAIFIVGVAFSSLAIASTISFKLIAHQENSLKASFLSQEAIEAIRCLKEEDWASIETLNPGDSYYLIKSGEPLMWGLVNGIETIDNFSRTIIIENVYRDANDNIIESGGTLDEGSYKINATTSWAEKGKIYQVSLVDYLTNWQL